MFPDVSKMKIYLICGKTDLRKGIDGLAALILDSFELDIYDDAIFLFCGSKADRFKALYWDKTGFVLFYKRIENGRFQWPRSPEEARRITARQLQRLLDGFNIENRKTIYETKPGILF